MKNFWAIVLLYLIVSSSAGTAGTVEEQSIDIRTRQIAKTLRCTVCQSESIFESQAPLAVQMRGIIRERVAQGQSDEEIRSYFLSRYGDYILMEPRRKGLNWLIWAGPFLILLVGGIILFRTLVRWTARTASAPSEDLPPLDEISRRRIERELRSLQK
jgi:cytochrome c-type biogenesis protein CcmH